MWWIIYEDVKRLRKFKDFSDVSAPSADEETELEVDQREVEALANEIRNPNLSVFFYFFGFNLVIFLNT